VKNARISIVILLTFLANSGFAACGQSPGRQREQTHFSAEDENVNHPFPIPTEVLALLAKDDLVRNVLEDEKIAAANLPTSWFSAAQVRLGGKGELDLIVASKGPLLEANIDPFYVFIHDSHGYKLALSISVQDLIVKRTRSHGYRDLESDGITASTITTGLFRFNGNEYKESSEKTTDIK